MSGALDRVDFTGRTAIVTGAGRGLGRAYAVELARRGANVGVNNRRAANDERDSAAAVVAEIESAGGAAVANHDSVAEPHDAESLVRTALDSFGRLDALINNAGIVRNALFEDHSAGDLDALIAVHLRGSFLVTQHAYRAMKAQRYGRIVSISSASGVFGLRGQSAYGAVKAALVGLTNVLALEGAEHGILANAVLPIALTNPGRTAAAEHLGAMLGPLSTRLTPEFVTPLVVYLASEACTTTHGVYSAIAGRYARIFTAVTAGWLNPSSEPPTAEEIGAHLQSIDAQDGYFVPGALDQEIAHVGRQGAGG
jgi:NAD(P)-dependent dehydrogenase (short-subunit alcohol dehydrogenase family)